MYFINYFCLRYWRMTLGRNVPAPNRLRWVEPAPNCPNADLAAPSCPISVYFYCVISANFTALILLFLQFLYSSLVEEFTLLLKKVLHRCIDVTVSWKLCHASVFFSNGDNWKSKRVLVLANTVGGVIIPSHIQPQQTSQHQRCGLWPWGVVMQWKNSTSQISWTLAFQCFTYS